MRRRESARARIGAVLVAVVLGALPSRARADLTIAAPSCDRIDVVELQRLLGVEIEDVAAEWSAVSTPVVLLGCAEDRVRIEITDPITDKSVARTVVLPEVDRERVLAIAIAQLFLTAWLELLIDDGEEADARRDSAAARAAERRAREAVERADVVATAADARAEAGAGAEAEAGAGAEPIVAVPPTIVPELSLEGGSRVRLDGENLATAAASLRGAFVIDESIVVGVRLGGEFARASRIRGEVDAYTATLGLGAGWRTPRVGIFFADVSAWVSAMWLMLEGRPRSPDVEGGATIAIAGEASLEIAPSLRLGPVIVAAPLGLGVIAFAPTGQVSDEAPIVIGGPFFSAALRVAITFSQL